MGLEEIARLFGRKDDAPRPPARQIELQGLRVLARRAPGAIEIDDGAAGLGRVGDEPANLVGIDLGGAETGIGEDLAQRGGEAPLGIVGQFLQIDAEGLAELQQQRHRHRPLVMLDEVEIAGADAEALGHLLLRQPALLPQAADLGPEERLADRHLTRRTHCYRFTKQAVRLANFTTYLQH